MREIGDVVRLCVLESRVVVQVIFLVRFAAGAVLGGGGRLSPVLVGAVAWLCVTLAIYLLNGVSDVPEDRRNGSTRPIASGRLQPPTAAAMALALGCAGAALAGTVSAALVARVVAMLTFGAAYSLGPVPLKRYPLGVAACVVVGGLLTYDAGRVAAGGAPTARLVLVAAAMSLWMCVGGMVKDLSDVAGDRAAGRRTLPVRRGEAAARRLMSTAALVLAVGALAPFAAAAPDLLLLPAELCGGAFAVAFAIHVPEMISARAARNDRLPYTMFMATQYAAQLTVFALCA